MFLKRPDDPAGEEDEGHGQRQVEIGVGPAEQGLVNPEALGGLMPPPDRAYPWNEAYQIRSENENENGGKEPERALDQTPAKDSLQNRVQALH
jgi:hypothetical protein